MSEELKPCPLCGCNAVVDSYNNTYTVTCPNCWVEVGRFDNKEDCIKEWNNRPIEDEKNKQIAELKAELSRNADDGYVGFMLGIEQMKKKLIEKDREIERLKELFSKIREVTSYRYMDLAMYQQKIHEIGNYCKIAIGKDTNDTDNNSGSMEKEQ